MNAPSHRENTIPSEITSVVELFKHHSGETDNQKHLYFATAGFLKTSWNVKQYENAVP